jgi:hypothetical protein
MFFVVYRLNFCVICGSQEIRWEFLCTALTVCEILGSQNIDAKDSSLHRYDSISLDESLLTFRGTVLPLFSQTSRPKWNAARENWVHYTDRYWSRDWSERMAKDRKVLAQRHISTLQKTRVVTNCLLFMTKSVLVYCTTLNTKIIVIITYSLLWHVHSLFHKMFFREWGLQLFFQFLVPPRFLKIIQYLLTSSFSSSPPLQSSCYSSFSNMFWQGFVSSMWLLQLAFLRSVVYRMFLSSMTLCNAFSLVTWSVH